MSTNSARAVSMKRQIRDIGRSCAVYIGENGGVLLRAAYTKAGLESTILNTAAKKNTLIGIYTPDVPAEWIEEDLNYEGVDADYRTLKRDSRRRDRGSSLERIAGQL